MDRRQFLGTSALAGAGLVAAQSVCTSAPPAPVAPPAAATGTEPFELHEATVESLQEGMRSGRLTARRITELYLARIDALNTRGPDLRAVIETNPDALAIADGLDAERAAGKVRSGLDAPEYVRAVAAIQRAMRADGIDAVMTRHRLDAIVAPTMGPAWPTDHVLGDRLDGGASAGPAAIAGYPDISVPMGFAGGLPVGISFFGRAWSEPVLLTIAYAFELATTARKAPGYLPTLA
jgi:Asp-tRNA(Asn)/Glu-tRNA(Gln) amidotransferase A subunit family amidase